MIFNKYLHSNNYKNINYYENDYVIIRKMYFINAEYKKKYIFVSFL